MQSANDGQVGGTHYKTENGVQHWDFVATALKGRYFEGNITKYIARHTKKNGLQDVEKSIHYAVKLRELYTQGLVGPIRMPGHLADTAVLHRFLEASPHLGSWERLAVIGCTQWCDRVALDELIGILGKVRAKYHEPEDATSAYVGQGSEP